MITYKELKKLVIEIPNDTHLGAEIRKMYWRSADRILEKEEKAGLDWELEEERT